MNKFNFYFTLICLSLVVVCSVSDIVTHRWGMLPTDIIFAVIFSGILLLIRRQVKQDKKEEKSL
jgi:uncharacterized membrane protein